MERIGIYGGTFNPPHTGHIQAAKQAVEALGLSKLLVIPDRIAPHKAMPGNSATPQQRLDMLRIALKDSPGIEVSDIELNREGPSYTYETILQLRETYPEARLVLLMGTDMFLSFHTWRNPQIILDNAMLGVFYRGEKGEAAAIEARKAEMEAAGAEVVLVKNPVINISSTQMRRLLAFRCAGELLPEDMAYWQLFGIPGRRDTLSLNNPEFFDLKNALSSWDLTQVQIRGRKAIFRQLAFYRCHFPGCEHAYISQIAPMVGVRESRRIRTVYNLTWEDLATRKKFPDRIAQSNYPVDIHGLPLDQQAAAQNSPEPWFEVPFRSLVVEGFTNLLVAGRCIGADFTAQSALRIQPTCRSRKCPEAAGIAAAAAIARETRISDLEGREVVQIMASLGAEFL